MKSSPFMNRCHDDHIDDGPLYRVLRKVRREGRAPKPLDILIVSARYGLLSASDPIENYDQIMTKGLSAGPLFRGEIARHLAAALAGQAYGRAHISLGRLYLAALGGADAVTHLARQVSLASGGIGQRQAQLRSWLLGAGGLRKPGDVPPIALHPLEEREGATT